MPPKGKRNAFRGARYKTDRRRRRSGVKRDAKRSDVAADEEEDDGVGKDGEKERERKTTKGVVDLATGEELEDDGADGRHDENDEISVDAAAVVDASKTKAGTDSLLKRTELPKFLYAKKSEARNSYNFAGLCAGK